MIYIDLLLYWDFKIVDITLHGFVVAECGCGCGRKYLYQKMFQNELRRIKYNDLLYTGSFEKLN